MSLQNYTSNVSSGLGKAGGMNMPGNGGSGMPNMNNGSSNGNAPQMNNRI